MASGSAGVPPVVSVAWWVSVARWVPPAGPRMESWWLTFYHCRYCTDAGYWIRAIFGLVSLGSRYLYPKRCHPFKSYLSESISCVCFSYRICTVVWWGRLDIAFALLSFGKRCAKKGIIDIQQRVNPGMKGKQEKA